jgi:IS30 family transposase
LDEREEISIGRAQKQSYAQIARKLGRHRSSVMREVKRNTSRRPHGYRAVPAEVKARRRAPRPKRRKLVPGSALIQRVAKDLAQGWSPQQVAGRLKRENPDDRCRWVSHETIYQAWYVNAQGGLRELVRQEREQQARLSRVQRRRRTKAPSNRGKIPDATPISQRPADAEDRTVPGHWEGDLIIGKGKSSAIATVVERASRYTMICRLEQGRRTAAGVNAALSAGIARLPADVMRTLTWDRGKELHKHKAFTAATGIKVYFADPYSPWQRGTNENTNRLIRHYFPRGKADFRIITQDELDRVAGLLNNRPRKVLGYRTPSEALQELLVATTT